MSCIVTAGKFGACLSRGTAEMHGVFVAKFQTETVGFSRKWENYGWIENLTPCVVLEAR
jgi:hypothetical protein